MTVTFYSNFLNHHQLPFCLEMLEATQGNFVFVATEEIPKERTDMGYEDMNKSYPFVVTAYESKANEEKAMKLALESDVVIHGSAPEIYLQKRMELNKLTFRYSERIFKRGVWRAVSPRWQKSLRSLHTVYNKKNLFMLCASAYTASDLALAGAYKDKCYKWGYFPEVIEYDIDKLISKKKNEKINLLWCARFLDWKHPQKALEVAKKLKEDGYNFHLNMIGIGEMFDEVKSKIKEWSLDEEVSLLGAMSPEKVREYMEISNIYLFTSDYNEGWGAVLNEAMNSACAVVASHAIGSVPYLIKNGENGLVYKNSDDTELYAVVKRFMDDKALRENCGKNAYLTLKNTWCAETAVQNFMKLCDNLLNNKNNEIPNGPCSKDECVSQRKMYESIISKK